MGEAAENLTGPASAALEQFKAFEHFCKCLLDAFAVVDETGRVLKCNPLFSQLVSQRTRQILKAGSLDELLKLDVAGKPLSIADMLSSPAPTRIDEVTGTATDGKTLNLIIGVYPFSQGAEKVGAFVLMRDVTAETNLQDKYKDKATQSITDPLTGLFNRAYFVDYLTSQLNTLESFPENAPQRIISVVMLDIDHFKKVNDVYGHQAGDYVIKMVADLLRKCFRKTDVVARYGGEEFLAILPGTEAAGAVVAADKLRQAVQGYKFEFEGTVIPVTISSGVAQIAIARETGTQAIARADAALYFSKQNGRNRVSLHDGREPRAPELKPAT
jgi:diguanylate cyclase (GGDEF)-like protein